MPYLDRHQTVIDQHFLRQEVCSNRGLVARAELLINLSSYQPPALQREVSSRSVRWDVLVGRTYWFIKLVLPTPLSPKMMI
jgi:hypothetical protein